MKVAAVGGGFPKLSETFILAQSTALIDLGHEVDVFARRRPGDAAVQPDVVRYGLRSRTHYFDTPNSRAGRLARALRTLMVCLPRSPMAMLNCLNLRRYRSLYAVLNNIIFFVAPFLGQHYDTVLCYWGGNGIDFIILKDVFPRTRFVTRFGGDDYSIGDEPGPEAFAILRQLGDAFMVQTDYYRATLRRYGFDDRKIVTFRHVVAVKEVPFRERSIEGHRVRILTIARLVSKKGLEYGIRAAVAPRAALPRLQIEYRIMGEGPLLPALTTPIRDLQAQETVTLLGAMTSPDVLWWVHASDLFLLPSLMEQAGYVLLEAQASGLPVVATRVGGVPEMVRVGRSALLVPAGDVPIVTSMPTFTRRWTSGFCMAPSDWVWSRKR